jgi:hypothetical protein
MYSAACTPPHLVHPLSGEEELDMLINAQCCMFGKRRFLSSHNKATGSNVARELSGLLFYPEDGCNRLFCKFLPDYTTTRPTKQ